MVALRYPLARRALVAAALVAGVAAVPGAQAAPAAATCGPTDVPGGEWRQYGHDYSNTRSQDREKVISAADAPLLSPAWTFSAKEAGFAGDTTGTPIVADGCLYTATSQGGVFALNADTGALVWKAKLPQGGGVLGTLAVAPRPCVATAAASAKAKKKSKKKKKAAKKKANKSAAKRKTKRKKKRKKAAVVKTECPTVFAAVSRTSRAEGCPPGNPCLGPYVAAFDQATGALVWTSQALDTQPGADMYASPVILGSNLMVGVSGGAAELGDDTDRTAFQGSMSFLDTETGQVLKKTWIIHPPKQPNDDFAGATIWSTPAVDAEAKVAYVGTSNPFKPQAEHKYTNSVIKVDLDRANPTFGTIVGSYKGTIDEYVPNFSQLPCYDIPGNPAPYYPQGLGSCGDLDMDFGAAPNLFTDATGRKLVGAGQKSGVYHVFDAKTMKPVWTQIVGPPSSVGGIVGSTAYDGHSIYGPITAPGYLWSLGAAGGNYRWFGAIADGAHWGPPVAVANGVVYTVDFTGQLDAYDARTGVLLVKRPIALGGSALPSLSWGGVSIARNTIYASVGTTGTQGFVVAFRPGGTNELIDDVAQTVGGLSGGGGGGGGGGAAGLAVVAGPGAASSNYATPVMITQVGGPLSFLNLDAVQHDVTSDAKAPDGKPLFHSALAGLGENKPIDGLDNVKSGQTYGFYCSIHPGMTGQLIVQ